MPRGKAKKATKEDATRVHRKAVPWESDRVSPESPSSLGVLMTWLTTPGNADRWRREKRKELIKEIIQVLAANGIQHRAVGDVHSKIWHMESQFRSASEYLIRKDQLDAFQRGKADSNIAKEVLKLCPQYRELVPFFGRIGAGKKAQVVPKSTANGAAAVNGVNAVSDPVASGSSVIAAGEWKKSLEKDRRKAASEKTQGNGRGEGVVNTSGEAKASKQKKLAVNIRENGGEKAEAKTANGANRKKPNDVDGSDKRRIVDVKKGATVVAKKDNLSGADRQMIDVDGKLANAVVVVEEEEEGVLADVEDGHSDVDKNNQNDGEEESAKSEDDEETDTISEQAEAQADNESDGDSSEEEEKPHTRIIKRSGVRSPFKTRPLQNESESSISEEEDNDENDKDESESDKEDGDGEERIPLAQADEVGPTPAAEESDQVEQDNEDNEEVEENDAVEPEDTEDDEEVEEEPAEDRSPKAPADSNDDSRSSSSGENEDADSEEETPPTQLKAPSDQDGESEEEEAKAEDNEDDVDMEKPVEQNEPVVDSSKKRGISNEAFISPRTHKRPRADRDSSSVTRDLEREAFIERAKQERDQRDELFKLERAKLQCELLAKHVQLTMERSLARKKLLGAGINLAEVDRVLPL